MEVNRLQWDERAPLHVASEFYDVDSFRAGKSTLESVEVEEVGDVTGRDLLHLQCHFGLDTLSWARRGAHVTGLDFSEPAVEAARLLAQNEGVDAEFVCANVYDAVEALHGRTYDVVYTGIGALCWLPDIDRWAATGAALVRPGGFLYLFEDHPFSGVLGNGDRFTDLRFKYAYDTAANRPMRWEGPGSYAVPDVATVHNVALRMEPQPRRDRLVLDRSRPGTRVPPRAPLHVVEALAVPDRIRRRDLASAGRVRGDVAAHVLPARHPAVELTTARGSVQ